MISVLLSSRLNSPERLNDLESDKSIPQTPAGKIFCALLPSSASALPAFCAALCLRLTRTSNITSSVTSGFRNNRSGPRSGPAPCSAGTHCGSMSSSSGRPETEDREGTTLSFFYQNDTILSDCTDKATFYSVYTVTHRIPFLEFLLMTVVLFYKER